MSSAFRPKDLLSEAQALEKNGQANLAASHYAKLGAYLRKKGKIAEAKTLFDRALKLSPSSSRLYVQRALCEWGEGDIETAKQSMEIFSQQAISSGKREKYTPYVETNLSGQPALRAIFYEAALALDRTDARPFLGLARARKDGGQHRVALGILLDALKTRTHQEEVTELLGEILELEADEKALSLFEKFKSGSLSFDDFLVLFEPVTKKEADVAESVGTNAQELSSSSQGEKDLGTLIEELEAELGVSLEERHSDVKPLIDEFRGRAESVLQGDSQARLDMAQAYFEMGLSREAEEELKKIETSDPFYLQAQCLLGQILIEEQSDLGALEVYQRCLRDDRLAGDVACECLYQLVRIYERLGDVKRAIVFAEQLEKSSGDYRHVHELKLRLLERDKKATQQQDS